MGRPLYFEGEKMDTSEEDRIRELIKLQSRVEVLEIFNREIKPQIDKMRRPDYAAAGVVVVIFGLLLGLQHQVESSDFASAISLEKSDILKVSADHDHNTKHLIRLEESERELRKYVDQRDNEIRLTMVAKEDHEIFDKERAAHIARIEERIQFLERKCFPNKP
jgi:hypothetical protein